MPLPFLSKPPVSVATSQKSPWPRLFGFAAVLLLSAACVLMTGYFARAWAEQSADASTNPHKKWRVAYVEGGPYTVDQPGCSRIPPLLPVGHAEFERTRSDRKSVV